MNDIIILILIIFLLIGGFIYAMKEVKSSKVEILKEKKQKEAIKKHKDDNNIPDNSKVYICTGITIKEQLIEGEWNVFIWKCDESLYFCGERDNNEIRKMIIPIKDIKFYTRKGDCRVETITEGGDISIGNAIVGGIVGLIIGAIVGIFILGGISAFVGLLAGVFLCGKTKININNKEIDNRKTYLNYLEDNENKQIIFSSKAYELLSKLVPEKEVDYIGSNNTIALDKTQKYNDNNDNIYKDIERLAELKDKGILTEEEFNQKKQLLLDKIQ